jgi:hypothetical protein
MQYSLPDTLRADVMHARLGTWCDPEARPSNLHSTHDIGNDSHSICPLGKQHISTTS